MIMQSHSRAYIWTKLIRKDTCTPNVHCSTIHYSQDMEVTKVSTHRWMGKEVMAYIPRNSLTIEKMK